MDNPKKELKKGKLRPENIGLNPPFGFPSLLNSWELELLQADSVDGETKLSGYHLFENSQANQFSQNLNESTPSREKFTLVIFHGFGEHSGRYMHFPYYLENTFNEMWMMDHVGHGKSGGKRGHVKSLSIILEDMERFLARVISESKNKKIILLGHSFGGLLTLKYIQEKRSGLQKISGVMISSPFLGLKIKVNVVKETLARVLLKAWDDLSLSSDFDATVLSKDVNLQKAYKNDRLNHSRMSPKMYDEIKKAQSQLMNDRDFSFDRPLSFFIPKIDPLVESSLTEEFYEKNTSGVMDKSLFSYENKCHEMMNEVDKELFFKAMENWIALKVK